MKISVIKAWNIAGALVSPIGMTRNLKEPYCVWKAVFHSWPACNANIVVASMEVKLGVDL